MFRLALLSCFLVSLDCASCMHIFAVNPSNQEVKNEGPITNIKLSEIDKSEISSIIFSCEISTDEKSDGFVSKSSSSMMTSNTFTNLQELETICNTIKEKLAGVNDANAKIELDIRTSLDKNEVSAILAKCFNFANIQTGKATPKAIENRNEGLPFAIKKSEHEPEQQTCPATRSDEEPCGLFAKKVAPEVRQNRFNRPFEQQRHHAQQPYGRSYVRWDISGIDDNTKILGEILQLALKDKIKGVSCKVTPESFTIYADNCKQVLAILEYIKVHGGLQNVLDLESFGEGLDVEGIAQQFDKIFSDEHSEMYQRNTKKKKLLNYPRRNRYHRSNSLWF